MRLARLPILLLLLALPLTGCSYFESRSAIRGNPVDADELKELVVGTSTKVDAQSLLGSPTTRATFDDNKWIYISEVTRPLIARTQGVEKQNVTELTFDQSGVLRDVRRLDKKNALPAEMVSRTTPSPGTEASFMQMLLGNIGKFSPTPTGNTDQSNFSVGSH